MLAALIQFIGSFWYSLSKHNSYTRYEIVLPKAGTYEKIQ